MNATMNIEMKNADRVNRLHAKLNAIQGEYAKKAVRIVKKEFDLNDAVERLAAIFLADGIGLAVALEIARQTPHKKKRK